MTHLKRFWCTYLMGIATVLLFLGGFTGNRIYPQDCLSITVSCSGWIDYEGLGMTPFQEHCTRWANGCGATECSFRGTRRVFARGKLPCDVLLLGEGPGEGENALGIPFIGIAGKQLDKVVSKAIPSSLRVAFSNMVSCIPREVSGAKAETPSDEQIKACASRLQDFVWLADGGDIKLPLVKKDGQVFPSHGGTIKLIVCVGVVARDWLDSKYRHSVKLHRKIPAVAIDHPAYILRKNVAQQGLLFQRCVVTIASALDDILQEK